MSESDPRKVNLAVFGMGRAGVGIHLPNLLHNFRVNLLYVVDLDIERMNAALEQAGASHITAVEYRNCDVVLKDPKVDAVLVCTPTEFHEEVCVKALNNKKAVLCEKPLAKSVEGIKTIYNTASENGVPILCSLNRRFDPNVRYIHSSLQRSAIGKIHTISMCSRDGHRTPVDYIKMSGGVFVDCVIHDMDIMCFLLGEYPTRVYATGHSHDPDIAAANDYDTGMVIFNFPSGAIGNIEFSRNSTYGHEGHLQVFGSDGVLKTGDMRDINVQLSTKSGSSMPPVHGHFITRYLDSYKMILEHFLDVVQGKSEPEVTLDHVLKLTRLTEACGISARSGQSVQL